MTIKVLKSPYSPRDLQQKLQLELGRFNVVVAHRRFGKTILCVNQIIQQALSNTKQRPQLCYIAPTKEQAKRIVWKYFKEYSNFIEGINYNEAELRIDFPDRKIDGVKVAGATVYVLGAEDPDTLRGMYLDGVVMDEVAQMPKSVWSEVLAPALSDRGGWAIFIGTPKGKNYFFELYEQASKGISPDGLPIKGWKAFMFKASETGYVSQDELELAQGNMPPEMYEQEYECSFYSAIQGTYYGRTLAQLREDGGIGSYNYNPKYPVITAWDLGMNDATSIWFVQQVDNLNYLIDYHEESDRGLNYHLNIIKGKPYVYDYHVLPHDVNQRNFSTGVTRLEEIMRAGLKVKVAPKLPVFDGINATRTLLPLCRFNDKKCEKGINSLFHYRSAFNEKLGVAQQQPIHDKNSHAADAFRYLAVTLKPTKSERELYNEKHNKLPTRYNSNFDPFSL